MKKFKIFQLCQDVQSGAKTISIYTYSPPLPPERQCCYHDTKLKCWLKTFAQHCQCGEGGNSKKISNYMSVDVSKYGKKMKYVKSH
jgi:hypothetical protein